MAGSVNNSSNSSITLNGVFIAHFDSQEKALPTLSPCIRLYSFGGSLQELFQSNCARNMGIHALLLLMSTVKPIPIAHNDLSATFLPVPAQRGGYCGSFFLVSVRPAVGISGVDGGVPKLSLIHI